MRSFDILYEVWLPGTSLKDGIGMTYSLLDAVLQAHKIQEIYGDTPLQNAAIVRLMIAFVRRAFEITSEDRWKEIWAKGRFSASDLEAYVSSDCCSRKFDLLSETHPFYQCAGLTTERPVTLNRLAADAASGNNPTLFDHRSDHRLPTFSASEAVRLLITVQSYSPGGGVAVKARIGDREFERPNITHAPAFVGATYWLTGANWFETVMLNINPTGLNLDSPSDVPWWERDDWLAYLTNSSAGRQRAAEAPTGIYDRLTWQSRLIRLIPETSPEGHVVFRTMYITQGRGIDSQINDPLKGEAKTKTGWYPVLINPNKAGWRDVHSLFQFNASGSAQLKKPVALQFIHGNFVEVSRSADFELHSVGAAADQAKLILWRHDRFRFPARLLIDDNAQGRLEAAIKLAEQQARNLRDRVNEVCELFLSPHSTERKAHPKDVANLFSTIDPRPQYWSRLESPFLTLLMELGNPQVSESALEGWQRCVKRELADSERAALDALGESWRAIQARAQAYNVRAMRAQTAKAKRQNIGGLAQ